VKLPATGGVGATCGDVVGFVQTHALGGATFGAVGVVRRNVTPKPLGAASGLGVAGAANGLRDSRGDAGAGVIPEKSAMDARRSPWRRPK